MPMNPSGACCVGDLKSHDPTGPQNEAGPLRTEQKSNGHVPPCRVQHTQPPVGDPPSEQPISVVTAPYTSSHIFVKLRLQKANASPVRDGHISTPVVHISGVRVGARDGDALGAAVGSTVGAGVGGVHMEIMSNGYIVLRQPHKHCVGCCKSEPGQFDVGHAPVTLLGS